MQAFVFAKFLNKSEPPMPTQPLPFRDGKTLNRASSMPSWAKPIAAIAMSLAK
jgi:hypothetical protein